MGPTGRGWSPALSSPGGSWAWRGQRPPQPTARPPAPENLRRRHVVRRRLHAGEKRAGAARRHLAPRRRRMNSSTASTPTPRHYDIASLLQPLESLSRRRAHRRAQHRHLFPGRQTDRHVDRRRPGGRGVRTPICRRRGRGGQHVLGEKGRAEVGLRHAFSARQPAWERWAARSPAGRFTSASCPRCGAIVLAHRWSSGWSRRFSVERSSFMARVWRTAAPAATASAARFNSRSAAGRFSSCFLSRGLPPPSSMFRGRGTPTPGDRLIDRSCSFSHASRSIP